MCKIVLNYYIIPLASSSLEERTRTKDVVHTNTKFLNKTNKAIWEQACVEDIAFDDTYNNTLSK